MIKTNSVPPLISANNATSGVIDIRAIKQPVPIPNLWLWTASTLGLLLLALLAWRFWRRRRTQVPPGSQAVAVPPHEKARTKLREAMSLIEQPRPFCILISDTIRIYLEERFDLHAPDRTTEEFLDELQASPLLTYEQKHTLGEFLAGCDLVKFARYEPDAAELKAIYDTALRLVDETEPPPVLAPQAGVQSAAPPLP